MNTSASRLSCPRCSVLSGPARPPSQFMTLYEQFDQHAKGLSDALDAIGVVLGRAGHTYAEAEQQIAASFR